MLSSSSESHCTVYTEKCFSETPKGLLLLLWLVFPIFIWWELAVVYLSLHFFSKEVHERFSHNILLIVIFIRDSVSRVLPLPRTIYCKPAETWQRHFSQNESHVTEVMDLKLTKNHQQEESRSLCRAFPSPLFALVPLCTFKSVKMENKYLWQEAHSRNH